eukprot:SM000106S13946  [mRNA]  locus=s106:105862:111881:+ [translate_table: standard]
MASLAGPVTGAGLSGCCLSPSGGHRCRRLACPRRVPARLSQIPLQLAIAQGSYGSGASSRQGAALTAAESPGFPAEQLPLLYRETPLVTTAVSKFVPFSGVKDRDDTEDWIVDTQGLEVPAVLDIILGLSEPKFLAPRGRRRNLDLMVYVPGLDGTGLFLERHLAELEAEYDIRCLSIPPTDSSSYADLADRLASMIEDELHWHERNAKERVASAALMSGSSQDFMQNVSGKTPKAAKRTVTIIAESFGAGIGVALAAQNAELVDYLVFINSGSGFRRRPLLLLGSRLVPYAPAIPYLHDLSSIALAPLLTSWRRVAETSQYMILPPFSTQLLKQDVVSRRLNMMAAWQPSDATLSAITATTLLVASGADRLLPSVEEAYGLATCIPSCQIHVLPFSGHIPLLEEDVNLVNILAGARFLPSQSHSLSGGHQHQDESIASPFYPTIASNKALEDVAQLGVGFSASGLAYSSTDTPAEVIDGAAVVLSLQVEEPAIFKTASTHAAAGPAERVSLAEDDDACIEVSGPTEELLASQAVGGQEEEEGVDGLVKAWALARVKGRSSQDRECPLDAFLVLNKERGDKAWMRWMFPYSSIQDRAVQRSLRLLPDQRSQPGSNATPGVTPDTGSDQLQGDMAESSANRTEGIIQQDQQVDSQIKDVDSGSKVTLGQPSEETKNEGHRGLGMAHAAEGMSLSQALPDENLERQGVTGLTWSRAGAEPETGLARRDRGDIVPIQRKNGKLAIIERGSTRSRISAAEAGAKLERLLLDIPQYRVWNWLTRPQFSGLENVPTHERPLLFVGNHTIFGIYDMPLMLMELQKRKGLTLRGLADPLHWATPFGAILASYGAVMASPRNCFKLLQEGECVLLYPGGGKEVAKRKGQKYKLLWKEQTDFVRLAMRFGCTIVPFAALGVEDAFDILMDPEEIMATPLGNIIRPVLQAAGLTEEVLLPLTSTVGLLPRPERLYFHFGEPIRTDRFSRATLADREACSQLYQTVRQSVEDGIRLLQSKRDKDPLRDLFSRTLMNVSEGWDGL